MRTIKHFEVETPKIIGVLCDRRIPKGLLRRLNRILAKQHSSFVCLPFRVEPKYLKNVIACMQLIDIHGLIITGDHTKRIGRFMTHIDKSAKKTGLVNVIVKRKKRFVGLLIEQSPQFYAEIVRLLTSGK